MRHIVKTESDEDLGDLIHSVKDRDGVEVEGSVGDLGKKVQMLATALKEFKDSGGNMEVLNYYMRGKGIAQRDIDNVMDGIESFFAEYGIEIDEDSHV